MSINTLFQKDVAVVNLGAETFKEELAKQAAKVVQVDWQPPAGGNPKLLEALDATIDSEVIDAANDKALEIFMDARPVLVDIARAIDVVPGMTTTSAGTSRPSCKRTARTRPLSLPSSAAVCAWSRNCTAESSARRRPSPRCRVRSAAPEPA